MTSIKLWIAIAALTCFLAGFAGGLIGARWITPERPAAKSGPFADYERALVESFQLPPERIEPLRAILARYAADLEGIKDRHLADYMSAMEPELCERGAAYRLMIRDKVLPENRRQEFDRLALGLPTSRTNL